MLQTLNIDFPSDILITLNESEEELKKRIKFSLAIQLYVDNKITIGKAAQVAGITRLEFESLLSENKITISNLSEKEVLEDINKLSVK